MTVVLPAKVLIAIDAAAVALMAISGALLFDHQETSEFVLGGIGLAAYLCAAPIFLMLGNHWARGFASFGLRLGLPPAASATAVFVTNCICAGSQNGNIGDLGPPIAGAIIGFGIGIVAAIIVHWWLWRSKGVMQAKGAVAGT